jgi:hypothetical protein
MYGVAAHHCVLEGGGALSQVCGEGRPLSAVVSTSKLVSKGWRKQGRPCHLVAALDPAFPNQQPDFADFQWPLRSGVGRGRSQGETESRGEVKAGAKEKWSKHNESALSGDSPLSLPLAYPGTEPASKKETDAMFACNPEKEVSLLFPLSFLLSSLRFCLDLSASPCSRIITITSGISQSLLLLMSIEEVFSHFRNLGLELV